MSELPKGWVRTSIARVIGPYETIDPRRLPDQHFRYVDIGSIDNQKQKIIEHKSFLGRDAPTRARRVINCGDVLFSTVRTYLKNVAVVTDSLDGALTSTGIALLRPNEAVTTGYLFNWVRSDDFISAISERQDGTLYPAVRDRDVSDAEILVPPLTEQKRIVEKLDSLTNRTARVRADLDRIQTLVERYKSRILDLAFSGKLTEDLRDERSAQGSTDEGLPEGWTVRLLGDISEIQGGIQVGKKRSSPTDLVEVPYLRVANVQRGWLNLEEIKTIAVTPAEKKRLLLQTGDVLMNEGGDLDKLGRGWVWRGQIAECIHQNHVFRIRLKDRSLPPEFVSHYANEKGQQYFIDQGTQTTNLASISKRKVSALPVPVPPEDEAAEIVRRIAAAFAWLDRLNAMYAAVSSLLSKLDAAILSKAFRGELVTQNPNDEPASQLLDRIRAEEEALGNIKRRGVPSPQKPAKRKSAMTNLIEVLRSKEGWMSAKDAAQELGIGDGSTSDEVEEFYHELRERVLNGIIEVERRSEEDWLRLPPAKVG